MSSCNSIANKINPCFYAPAQTPLTECHATEPTLQTTISVVAQTNMALGTISSIPLPVLSTSLAEHKLTTPASPVPSSITPKILAVSATRESSVASSPMSLISELKSRHTSPMLNCLLPVLPTFPTDLLHMVSDYLFDSDVELFAYMEDLIKTNPKKDGYELLMETCDAHLDLIAKSIVRVRNAIKTNPERVPVPKAFTFQFYNETIPGRDIQVENTIDLEAETNHELFELFQIQSDLIKKFIACSIKLIKISFGDRKTDDFFHKLYKIQHLSCLESIFHLKRLIKTDPEKAYKLLAELIAAKTIDLSEFEITAQDLVGLATHVAVLSRVTFGLYGGGHNLSFKPGSSKNNLHNCNLIEILHFADIHHIKEFGKDLHLLGAACDNSPTKIEIIVYKHLEYLQEFSRVLINVGYCPHFDLTVLLGRSLGIRFNENNCENARINLECINTEKLAQTLTTNSTWDVSQEFAQYERGVFNTNLLVAILKHLVSIKQNIVECVLVNSYREACQNSDDWEKVPALEYFSYCYNNLFSQTDDWDNLCIQQLFRQTDDEKQRFLELVDKIPLCSTMLPAYYRDPRPETIASEFYTKTLQEAKLQASPFFKQREAK